MLFEGILVIALFTVMACLEHHGLLAVIGLWCAGFVGNILAFNKPGFWILVVAASALLVGMLDKLEEEPEESWGIWPTVTLVIVFLLLQFCGDVKVFTYISGHSWQSFAIFLVVYFLIGAAWCTIKFWLFAINKGNALVEERRKTVDNLRQKFFAQKEERPGRQRGGEAQDRQAPPTEEDFQRALATEWETVHNRSKNKKPIAIKCWKIIFAWAKYWPWSMFWTLLNDPIRKAWEAIVKFLQSLHQKIADYVYRNMDEKISNIK